MRLQIRVTPAHQELLDHLESIDREYRGKRLIALAAMQLAQMNGGNVSPKSHVEKGSDGESVGISESGGTVLESRQLRKPPRWRANGHNA